MCPGQEGPELGGWHLEDQRQTVTKNQVQHSRQDQITRSLWELKRSQFSAHTDKVRAALWADIPRVWLLITQRSQKDSGCGTKENGADGGYWGCFLCDLITQEKTLSLMAPERGLLAEWMHFVLIKITDT